MIPVLAWRNIWRNKMRSIIIIGSVAMGVLAGLFILALYQGMIRSRIRTIIEDEVAHLQLHHPAFKEDYKAAYTISNIDKLMTELEQMDAIAYTSSRVIAQGMLATPTSSSGVEIRGVEPERENRVSNLQSKIVEGQYFPGKRKNELLVGKKLADKKGLKVNAKVVLTFSDKDKYITSGAFRIAGIYQSTNTALDERIVYTRRVELSSLLNVGEEVHEVAIVLKSDDLLEPAYWQVQQAYPALQVQTWKQLAPESEWLITVTNQSSLIILIIIMLALAFGIINTMLMAVLERTRETGMMIALGMSKIRLFGLVLLETIFLTVIGSPVGMGLAWLITVYLSRHGIDTTAFAEALMGDYGFEKIIYPEFPVGQIGRMLWIVAGTAILSSIIPAARALRMEPADALRK